MILFHYFILRNGVWRTLEEKERTELFNLPNETLVYPAHDYEGRFVSTVAQEKIRNPRLGNHKSKTEFIEIMNSLDLPYPRKIYFAVPGNEACGVCPPDVPDEFRSPCEMHDQG